MARHLCGRRAHPREPADCSSLSRGETDAMATQTLALRGRPLGSAWARAVVGSTVTLMIFGWLAAPVRSEGAKSIPADGAKPCAESVDQMIVTGRVLGRDGKPVPRTHVAVLTANYRR